jgi:hypothetical protein
MTWLDGLTHDATIAVAPFSPLASKIINDGSYLRALFGSLAALPSFAAAVLGVISVVANDGQFLPPPWQIFLAMAIIGIFDAFAGFVGIAVFIIGMLLTAGISGQNQIQLMLGIIVVGFGPALISSGFRTLRKNAARDEFAWWERLVDLAVITFFAGWTATSMVSSLPALAGLTLSVANHVSDFAVGLGVAIAIRIVVEEIVARLWPARLDRINPTEIPEPGSVQKLIAISIRFGLFLFMSNAIMGFSWHIVVGSLLFVIPVALGWFSDRFPNSPLIWKLMPTGVPGLAFTLLVAMLTSAVVGSVVGASRDLAAWSFAILPIPLLLIQVLQSFGRHGVNEDDDRPIKNPKYKWIYRVGGVVMLAVTLKLAGVI